MKKLIVAVVVVWALVLAVGVTIGVVLVTDEDEPIGPESLPPSSAPPPPSSEPPTTQPKGPVPAGLEPYYGQQVTWEACGDIRCATIEVPLDYSDPGGDTIELSLASAPATGDRIGAMVVNPGGPGAPGTTIAEEADGYFDPELRARYDVVGFDPRGTGSSTPVDCLTDDEVDEYVATDPDPDDRAEVAEFVRVSKRFWAGCEEKSGDLGSHVSTIEAARDMDVIRAVLGEEKLTYFGFSYGTRLGATYATLFPDNVGRFVLDGAVDPSLSTLDGALTQAKGFETALRSYVADCVDKGSCFLGDTVAEGLRTISDLLDDIEEEPLPGDGDRELAVGNAFYGLVLPLYLKDNWPLLDAGLQEALDGSGKTLLFLSDFYGSRQGGRYVDNSLEAISVINCLDDPWSVPARKVRSHYDEFRKASPTFGEVFAWGLTACHGTPFERTEPDLEITGAGAAPIVVIGTTRDPATPYEEAVAMAEQLESGVLLSRDGDGHTGYNKGNACVDDAVHAYLVDGAVPADGTEC